ncbi:MAG: LacI family DNA-binding transcriptional regulator [Lachnospiraceae bacterium]|nr:LacI family DNA-binding transcriptional regulator [Lachnospiraceae bacterium]
MATLKDIANIAHVSPAAVSRILNHDDSLSVTPETREKVLTAAKELGYKKKSKASAQKMKKMNSITIGLLQWYSMFQELEDPYYQNIRNGIESCCMNLNIKVIRIFKTDQDYKKQLAQLDGLICVGKYSSDDIMNFQKLTKHFIIVDMLSSKISFNCIALDFKQAVYDIMDYLVSLGHKRIGYLGGIEQIGESIYFEQRKSFFIDYCTRYHLEYEPYMIEEEFSAESGFQMMNRLLEKDRIPTAVFAASDPIAIGAMRALHEAGLRIPKDISVVGFDNISVASYTNPPLTTIHAPAEMMGKTAVEFLYQKIMFNSEAVLPIRITFPCELIVRDSAGPTTGD